MSNIQFRLAARTDAAGKYNESAPLEGNEDNMFVDADLCNQVQGQFMADKVVDLSEKGCLMVVADGMGGMNAGEVASDIAIRTVMGYFAPERMSQKSFSNAQARANYMEEVVVAADAAIKADAQNNKEHEGMGSTLIMAWLCDGQVCITWCGDSRAYLFRPAVGFKQVSKDHSYVQGLVDEGKITEAEAFDHPYGNIITRSLGDPEKKAKPDSICFNVYQGDIIMLCSDGLSGVLRDHKTIINGERVDTENLEDLIRNNRATMAGCRDELFAAAERNDWYDNVTAILCEIVKGDPLPVSQAKPAPQAAVEQPVTYAPMPDPSATMGKKRSKVLIPVIAIAAVLLLGVAGLLAWLFLIPKGSSADAKFFAECRKKNDVTLYRSYVSLYPKGDSVAVAKAWIKNWEQDSTNRAKGLTPAEPTDDQSIADNTTTSEEKVEKKEDKVDKEERKKKEEDDAFNKCTTVKACNNYLRKYPKGRYVNQVREKLKELEGNGSDSTGKTTSSSIETKEKEFTTETDLKKIAEEHPKKINEDHPAGFTPVEGGLSPVSPGKPVEGDKSSNTGKKNSGETSNDEEAEANNAKTIDRCCDFVAKYGDKSKYYGRVCKVFQGLYQQRLNKCKTVEECEDFLKKHDKYMSDMKMSNSRDDSRWYNEAKNKKEKLEKERKEATEKIGDGIINGTRPETGVNAGTISSAAGRKTKKVKKE